VPFTVLSATQVRFTVPAGSHTSAIQLTNPANTVASVATFKVTPKVDSFSVPAATRGAPIQILGSTFNGATAVKFGTVAATSFTVDDDSHITVTVPSTATTNKVSVTTPAGTGTSTGNFTVILPPTISSFSPTSGVAGTVVTINGANFANAFGVTFNGVDASSFTVVSPTQAKATVPPGATTGKISVQTIAGIAVSAANFTIPLAITDISPTSGSPGDLIVVTGTGFLNTWGVKFGDGVAFSGSVISDTEIQVFVPGDATDGPIVVSNGALSSPSPVPFDVIGFPVSPPVSAPSASPRKNTPQAATGEWRRPVTRMFVRA
jgi:hypothetical protein